MDAVSWWGVAMGGALGALTRTWVSVSFTRPTGWPWATFAVNLLGCAILATLAAWALNGKGLSPRWQATLGAGFCGGLTTFSTFAVEFITLGGREGWSSALAYAVLSVLASFSVVALIFWLVSES